MSDTVREIWLLWVKKDIAITSVEIISIQFYQKRFFLNSGWHSTDWDVFQSWTDPSWLISESVQILVHLQSVWRGHDLRVGHGKLIEDQRSGCLSVEQSDWFLASRKFWLAVWAISWSDFTHDCCQKFHYKVKWAIFYISGGGVFYILWIKLQSWLRVCYELNLNRSLCLYLSIQTWDHSLYSFSFLWR